MANQKLSALATQLTTFNGNERLYVVDDPAGTPASKYTTPDDLRNTFIMSGGGLIGGYFSVTVASNNITLAVKTRSGGNPSATDPVYVVINNSIRAITATLSVTKNAGTNWFNSGSTAFAAKEVDYFVYAIWNTTPATDIVDIGFSRIPFGRVYSDFSGTTTNEKYLAYANGSAPTSTDACTNIGRFAATLSAGAGYTWSVPTFTNVNQIHGPIYNTRVLTWEPSITGFSAFTNNTWGYAIVGDFININFFVDGTSNATTMTCTLPFTTGAITSYVAYQTRDNTVYPTNPGMLYLPNASSTGTFYKDWTGAAFTNSGTKSAHGFVTYCVR